MTRYLTPAKLGLLALIELYTESAVPSSAAVTILSFILGRLIPSTLPGPQNRLHDDDGPDILQRIPIDIKDFERVLSPHPAASDLPGRTLYDVFLRKLWSIDSLDALYVFFEGQSNLLVKTKEETEQDREMGIPPPEPDVVLISRTSPFGEFIRKAQFEFRRLHFDGTIRFWRSYTHWRHASFDRWRKLTPATGEWSFDAVLQDGDAGWTDDARENFASVTYSTLVDKDTVEGLVSEGDLEALYDFQLTQMDMIGTRLPESVKDRLKAYLDSRTIIPSVSQYVRYLEAWKAGDYTTAFDMLHKYFDYAMQNKDRSYYQYALLNLAVIQCDFGCYHEAVAAMQEAISTARENKDMHCLNWCLSWLYNFGKVYPQIISKLGQNEMLGVEKESLAFMRVKAREMGNWALWSSALLGEARLGLESGESVATAFENIIRSSELIVTKNLPNALATHNLVMSALWSRLGLTCLSKSYCQLFLQGHARYAGFDNIVRVTFRLAWASALKGQYTAAMDMLEALDSNSLRSLKPQRHWLQSRGILQLKRDIHHNNLDGAEQLLNQLLHSREEEDVDDQMEIQLMNIEVMKRRGDYTKALTTIDKLVKTLKDDNRDLYYQITLLVCKAQLHDLCGRPQKGFSIAVKAASVAWRSMMLPVLWHALGAIANILNSLDEFDAAARMLSAILPRAEEVEDAALSAQLYSWLIDAHMGMAGLASEEGQGETGARKRTQHLTRALDFIDRAFDRWSAVEDVLGQCDMMAKKATVMKLVGEHRLANDYAAVYLELKRGMKVKST